MIRGEASKNNTAVGMYYKSCSQYWEIVKFFLSNSRKSPDHQLFFIQIAILALKNSGKSLGALVGNSLSALGDFNRSIAPRSKCDYSSLPLFEAAFSFGFFSTRKMLVNISKSSRQLLRWSGGCSTSCQENMKERCFFREQDCLEKVWGI